MVASSAFDRPTPRPPSQGSGGRKDPLHIVFHDRLAHLRPLATEFRPPVDHTPTPRPERIRADWLVFVAGVFTGLAGLMACWLVAHLRLV